MKVFMVNRICSTGKEFISCQYTNDIRKMFKNSGRKEVSIFTDGKESYITIEQRTPVGLGDFIIIYPKNIYNEIYRGVCGRKSYRLKRRYMKK